MCERVCVCKCVYERGTDLVHVAFFVEKILEKQSKRHKDFNFGGSTMQRAT